MANYDICLDIFERLPDLPSALTLVPLPSHPALLSDLSAVHSTLPQPALPLQRVPAVSLPLRVPLAL